MNITNMILSALVVLSCALTLTTAFQTPPSFLISSQRPQQQRAATIIHNRLAKTSQRETGSTTLHMSSPKNKNNPILLIGCSGVADEIYRLASSLGTTATTTTDEDNDNDEHVIEVIRFSEADVPFVMAPSDLESMIINKELSDANVITLDYSHALFTLEGGRYKEEFMDAFDLLVKQLSKHCVTIYVNVHPELGLMNPTSREIKQTLETDMFIKYSDYEVVVKDDGLDPTTRLALESSDFSQGVSGVSVLDDLTPEDFEEQTTNWKHIQWEVKRIVARARLPHPTVGSSSSKALLGGRDTFFLSLSFPEINQTLPYIKALCEENDAMEFRTDLLSCRDDRFEVLYSLQSLRKYCRDHAIRAPGLPFGKEVMDDVLPMVYTVRTKDQAGSWPDKSREDIERMFSLLKLGLRNGVEVLDVESSWDKDLTDDLLSLSENYSTCILGSYHLLQPTSLEHTIQLFHQCALSGRAHGAKLVLTIDDKAHDHMAIQGSDAAQLDIPTVSLILGESGQYSRILNRNLTPTTHNVLPFVAAPGQLSAGDIMERRLSDGFLKKLQFMSVGAVEGGRMLTVERMHEAAWAACDIPYKFSHRYDNVEDMCNSEDYASEEFGGGSVFDATSQRLMLNKVDVLTDDARVIGYVDTLSRQVTNGDDNWQKDIVGANTDWKGLYVPIKRLLDNDSGSEGDDVNTFALLLGSSETNNDCAAAYAVNQLGLNVIYYQSNNASDEDSAHKNMMKEKFGAVILTDLASPSEWNSILGDGKLKAIISTLSSPSEPQIPPQLFHQKPIVCEMMSRPYYSPLLLQAESNGCDLVRGSEVMWEKGVAQFETWMGRSAPYKVMKTVVRENCLSNLGEELDWQGQASGVVSDETTKRI
mmetsp:Transcript_8195/g.10044  ORF Transcript_8195/g.10044 Transcript_8195/m.10044 type:complete len:873 (-) Transcript_8195:325-2943(-)|eukprot:CAMPEP_0172506656 /NCGR_PEP_ID=MMETSP1066-20121228/196992_1 /TAXON_ID=671091 /ORGANISM="Coscinodiscus wailesii, Strain CCMP2513" /LENGTH=872 /DNA_ID=CAMNT_0013283777 /DNA_START=139 /DNA_END=2757 /DNA_ORIENTATION=+